MLRRVVRLLSRYSVLEASNEASLRQAQNVSQECERLMDENDKLKKVMLKGMSAVGLLSLSLTLILMSYI